MKTHLNSSTTLQRSSYNTPTHIRRPPDGNQLPMTYFFSQRFLDIKAKFKCLEGGPLTPQAEVLAVAFKVHQGRYEKNP